MKNMGLGIKLTIQNLRMRFEKSHLGIVWFFIEPLVLIIIFYVVFTKIFKVNIPHYSIFLCLGILPWTFHASAISDASRSLFVKKNLIINASFDIRLIPLSTCIANGISFCISLLVLACVMVFGQKLKLGIYCLYVPVIIVLQTLFCYGVSLLISLGSVFVRDIMYGINLFLLLWFYGSPIFYSFDMVPHKMQWIIRLNPLTYFISGYRSLMLLNEGLPLKEWIILFMWTVGFFILGNAFFYATKGKVIKKL